MIDLFAFLIFSFIAIISAIFVLEAEEIVHSVMFLAAVFVSIAGLYILLNAEYVAVVQILIYAGAVTVLILFAIMLTKREIISKEAKK